MNKKYITLLLLASFSIAIFGAIPQSQKSGQNYIKNAREALNRKDYDGVMRWADKYVEEYNTYEPLADIAEQLRLEAKRIYPNDKKAYLKPMGYAARMGNAHAIYNVGMDYLAGQFVPKDEAKGIALVELSSKLGYSEATRALHMMENTYDYIVYKEKQRRYDSLIIGAVTIGALVVAAASIIGNSSSYGGSYSFGNNGSSNKNQRGTNGSSSKEQNKTSTNNSVADKQNTCKLTIYYETIKGEYKKLIQNNIEVYFHEGRLTQSGGWKKYWVDTKGNCTITWSDDRGDAIEGISFSEDGHGYIIKDIMLKDGGTYNLKADYR